MDSLAVQGIRFWSVVLMGVGFGLVQDIFAAFACTLPLRRRHWRYWDLLFWMLAGPLLLAGLFQVTWWSFRLYVFIAFGLGLGAYLLLGRQSIYPALLGAFRLLFVVLRFLRRLFGGVVTIGLRVGMGVVRPLWGMTRLLLGPVFWLAHRLGGLLRIPLRPIRRLLRAFARWVWPAPPPPPPPDSSPPAGE